jgi:hypothetical protein
LHIRRHIPGGNALGEAASIWHSRVGWTSPRGRDLVRSLIDVDRLAGRGTAPNTVRQLRRPVRSGADQARSSCAAASGSTGLSCHEHLRFATAGPRLRTAADYVRGCVRYAGERVTAGVALCAMCSVTVWFVHCETRRDNACTLLARLRSCRSRVRIAHCSEGQVLVLQGLGPLLCPHFLLCQSAHRRRIPAAAGQSLLQHQVVQRQLDLQ